MRAFAALQPSTIPAAGEAEAGLEAGSEAGSGRAAELSEGAAAAAESEAGVGGAAGLPRVLVSTEASGTICKSV